VDGPRTAEKRNYEQTALDAQTWLEVACVAYLCGRLRVEPT
jgi:hypothetical protein